MIKFKDLSWSLKVAVVACWIYLIEFIVYFIIGFVGGLNGTI